MRITEWVDGIVHRSEFLNANDTGAAIGEILGYPLGAATAVAAVVAVTVAAAPAIAASEAAGAATLAAGGTAAFAYQGGYKIGHHVGPMLLINGIGGAAQLGRLGCAYAGAGVQAALRHITE